MSYSQPDAFTAGQWTATDLGIGGAIRINVSTLPSINGAPAVLDIEYSTNGGSNYSSSGQTTTGNFDINGLTDGTSYGIKIRVRTAGGYAAGASDTKTRTPTGVPDAFTAGQWSIADLATAGDARVTVSSLPAAHGSTVTAIKYRINGGAWTAFSPALTGTGTGDIAGFTDGVATTVELQAVNANGGSADSDDKSVTTTSASPPVWTPVEYGVLTDSGNNFTKVGANLGTPGANRRVAVVFGGAIADSGRVFASATINGVAATLAVEKNDNNNYVGIIHALVPSGSTGDIVITMADSLFSSNRYEVYTADNSAFTSTTPVTGSGTQASGVSATTGSLASQAGGAMLVGAGWGDGSSKSPRSYSDTKGDTISEDGGLGAGAAMAPAHASGVVGGAMTVTASWTGTFSGVVVAACWR